MKKEELAKKIDIKEKALNKAERESNAWSSGKYKNSSNANVSKIYVDALKKEINDLYKKLSELEK